MSGRVELLRSEIILDGELGRALGDYLAARLSEGAPCRELRHVSRLTLALERRQVRHAQALARELER